MLHWHGSDRSMSKYCISQEVVVTGMYSDKDIYILLTHIQTKEID